MLQKSPMYSYIPVTDLTRARKFYEQKLGFKPKEDVAGGVVYEFGERTACFMYPTPNAGTSKASKAFWQVDDIEREVAELKARGVAVRGIRRAGHEDPGRHLDRRRREEPPGSRTARATFMAVIQIV